MKKFRLSACISPCNVATKFESAELKPNPLAPNVICGAVLASVRRCLLIQFALAFQNSDFLIKCLNLLLVGTGDGLLFRQMLTFEALTF